LKILAYADIVFLHNSDDLQRATTHFDTYSPQGQLPETHASALSGNPSPDWQQEHASYGITSWYDRTAAGALYFCATYCTQRSISATLFSVR
ncbi:hypothetical protein BDB00DRAFT_763477, partial [Zychaea mexicana]|uniref:uncharacterized protein n=1 Tax=Zychaea mexicana TaxID=64656 RepID=UPI0022FE7D23